MRYTPIINNIPRLYQLDEFKSSKYSFWFLYSIKGVQYDDGKYFSDFHFVNKLNPDDDDDDDDETNGIKVKIKLNISFYTFFTVGCVFTLDGYLFTRAPYKIKTDQNVLYCSLDKLPQVSHFNLFDNNDSTFFCSLNDDSNCPYFIFNTITNGEEVKVMISEYVLSSYIFFRNTFVTKGLIDNTLIDCFDLSNIDSVDLENGEKALRIFYNNRLILPHEVFSIAQFFNIVKGINAINSISSNLIQAYNSYIKDPYLHINFDFMSNIEMELIGKIICNKKDKFFYVYEIAHLDCQVSNLTGHHNLLLAPIFRDEDNFHRIKCRRSLENFKNNGLKKREREGEHFFYHSRRPVFFNGINVYINFFNTLHPPNYILLRDFYSYHISKITKDRRIEKLAAAFLRNFKKHEIKASIVHYNSLNDIISNLVVANSEYSFLILELDFLSSIFYYIELSNDFILILYNNQKTKVSLIDLILIVENVLFNYALENYRFRSFEKLDTLHYQLKFGINIHFQSELIKGRKKIHAYAAFEYVGKIKYSIISTTSH